MSAPSAASSSSACSSVLFVYVVVTMRSDFPSLRWRRRASRSGRMPLHRTKAMTTSMASDDWISARISCPSAGSPREFVRSVVSRSSVNGASSVSGDPSGLRRRMADNTRAGSIGRSTSQSIALLTCESRSISREMICAPAWARPCSGSASSARVTTRAKCRDSRSAASASARARNSGVTAATTRSASRLSSATVSSASYNPGWSGWSATAEECASDCTRRRSVRSVQASRQDGVC